MKTPADFCAGIKSDREMKLMDRQKVLDYINKKYKVQPEYPWRTSPNSAVFRHSDNNKWFALLMDIPGDKV